MRTTEEMCQRFRGLGLKVTPQRRFIFQALEGNTDHPSAEAIYEEVCAFIPEISLATVYNTLRELVDRGEVRELNLGDGKSRYDPDISSHQHLVCVRCHEVADVICNISCLELTPEQSQRYHVLGADVTFYGLCPACQQQGNRPGQALRLWGISPTA
ncbi:MAG: transcriptional repressor [Chloroflexi bacterium]|nr:transcriptional repressor [Chloroflexota bacterium]